MQCPSCQYDNSRVLESRSTEGGKSIRRRRECLKCKHRFTTYERIEFIPLTVIKKDGSKESFDRSKILRGMVRACEKTGISPAHLDSLIDDIEVRIQQMPQKEITTKAIGLLVLTFLKKESEVAYIRFASVYGQFQGIDDFVAALENLQKSTTKSNKSTTQPQWHYHFSESPETLNPSPYLS
jgi:transcriptional repressor NrdR